MSWLDQIFGPGLAGALRAVSQYLPTCSLCEETAVFRCLECGSFVCHRHAFVSMDPLQAVCRSCAAKAWPAWARPGGEYWDDWPYAEAPWDVLGVREDASDAEIKIAYRAASMRCHPDRGGSPEAQTKINAAAAAMRQRAAA